MELSESEKRLLESTLDHAEEDRQEGLRKAIETWETIEAVKLRFDDPSFGSHEAVDRAFIFMESWQHYVENHPTVLLDPKIHRMAMMATSLMAQVYNAVATKDVEQTSSNDDRES